jgi:hypothetical protein
MFTSLLAILAVSAAVGIRIAFPLLVILGIEGESFWSKIPLFNQIPLQVVWGVLSSWSLVELLGSKQLLGQRILQLIQLILSPFLGLLLAVTMGKIADYEFTQLCLIAISSGLFAFVLQLAHLGWFFRWGRIPLLMAVSEDILSILLVFSGFNFPEVGGLVALILLWLAIRSFTSWKKWYQHQSRKQSKKFDP